MLMLKLKRIGKKHQASFRLIAIEKRTKINGKCVEDLGWYNPREDKFEFNKERILHWIKNGAQSTDTVYNLLITSKIIDGKKRAVHKQPKKTDGAKGVVVPVAKASEGAKPAAEAEKKNTETPRV